LVLSFALGTILYVLAQAYGVQAFIMSSPDNGRFASLAGNDLNPDGDDHDPWVQGKALTVYASLAWLCSLLGGTLAIFTWRLPHWDKTL